MPTSLKNWLKRSHDFELHYHVIIILILLSLISTAVEILSIGMFLPIFQFVRLDGDLNALVADSSLWQYVINGLTYAGLDLSLQTLLSISFSLFICRQIFTYFRLVYVSTIRQRITQIQRNRMFTQYIDANTTYHDNNTLGSLVNIVLKEIDEAIMAIMAPTGLIVYFAMFSGYIFMLLFLSWEMTLISIIVLFVAMLAPNVWIKKSTIIGRKLVDANTTMSEFLVGRLRSPRLVRLAGTEQAEKDEFCKLTEAQRQRTLFGSILQAKTDVVMEPIVIGMSFILFYFSYDILQIQIETIGIYIVIALRLIPIVKGIIKQWQKIQRSLGSIEVVENRFKLMKESIEQDTGAKSLSRIKRSFLIDKVNYRYLEGQDYVLKDITIEFKANKLTAIVGPSGSGKSTLIDLLPRLRLPTKGSIKIDNVNIDRFTLRSLRRIISYVPQSPQIFNGTIKHHILYGKENATNEEIREATHLAYAEDFIAQLPEGLNTVLGEDAIRLSGGQKQRLDLARALVRKAPILILDEPTSNLDIESEDIFKKSLEKIRKETNTMIIIVSHRLNSICDADNIVVLNKCKVEASGTHSELLQQDGWYSKAWNIQSSEAINISK